MGGYSDRCAATLLGWQLQYPAKSRLCMQASPAEAPWKLCCSLRRRIRLQPARRGETGRLQHTHKQCALAHTSCSPFCMCFALRVCLQGGPAVSGLTQVAPLLGKQVYLVNGRVGAGEGSSPLQQRGVSGQGTAWQQPRCVRVCMHSLRGAIQLAPPLAANS